MIDRWNTASGDPGTTNAIESLNYQLRKITKTKGHFPTDDAVLKILYLGLRNIGNHRGGDLGTGTWGWNRLSPVQPTHEPVLISGEPVIY